MGYTYFLICEYGAEFVEGVVSHFEFFSNRISNDNPPLYYEKNMKELKILIERVRKAVEICCKNINRFRKLYCEANGIYSIEKYYESEIDLRTIEKKSVQLHTERIIFAHIAYLNFCRLFKLKECGDTERDELNCLFVDEIDEYLKLYEKHISGYMSQRKKVADGLKAKVNECKDPDSDNEKKYQSIKLDADW